MKDRYILMHKNTPCGVLSIDRDSGALEEFKLTEKEYGPFLGNADERLMKIWWKHRAVPGNRKDIVEAIRNAACETNEEYLAKNLALSLTDTYWICPAGMDLAWDDVKLYGKKYASDDYLIYQGGSSYDPNASLGGEMDKYWDISGEVPFLIKKAYQYNGQQSVNEAFATHLHKLQETSIAFAEYAVSSSDDGAALSSCMSFTSEKIEFVSAYELLRSSKKKTDLSNFGHYLDVCEKHGLDRAVMQKAMDYLILSDFAITNVDEHPGNFGVLRDTETMELIGPAPIFDSGNSMFFNCPTRDRALTRIELLEMNINSINKKEEDMLHHVADVSVLDYDKLPSHNDVVEFYSAHGITEERSIFIAAGYCNKLSLLQDFQSGIKVSLYHEKQP